MHKPQTMLQQQVKIAYVKINMHAYLIIRICFCLLLKLCLKLRLLKQICIHVYFLLVVGGA